MTPFTKSRRSLCNICIHPLPDFGSVADIQKSDRYRASDGGFYMRAFWTRTRERRENVVARTTQSRQFYVLAKYIRPYFHIVAALEMFGKPLGAFLIAEHHLEIVVNKLDRTH